GIRAGGGDRAVLTAAASGVRGLHSAARAASILALVLLSCHVHAADRLVVTWHPARPRVGDVSWLHVRGASDTAVIEGSIDNHPLTFFPYAGGQAALVGLDIDTKSGSKLGRLAVLEPGLDPRRLSGKLNVAPRVFTVQRLTVPPEMADLDPETERRATSEAEHLQMLYRTISPERLWRGAFVRPV